MTAQDDAHRRRIGVYLAPRPTSPLGERGGRWLGRYVDPVSAPPSPPMDVGLDLDDLTAEPRVYGFHATLKAPFHLAPGVDDEQVRTALEALAAAAPPVTLDGLVVDVTRGFASLVPEDPDALGELEAACVVGLEPLRRPAEEMDLARRRRQGLTPRQDELLGTYGYPWVLDEFRPHFTLTRRLQPGEIDPVLAAAHAWFDPVLDGPHVVDEICLVEQIARGEPFTVVARHPLRGSSQQ